MVQRNNDISLEALVSDICEQRIPLESLSRRIRKRIEQLEALSPAAPSQRSGAFWKAVAFGDSLARIGLFLEQNFSYIETVGVLAVSRYLFELTVWLKLLQTDSRYGLVYYHQLLKANRDYYNALQLNAEREVAYLRLVDAAEDSLRKSYLADALSISDEEAKIKALLEIDNKVMKEVDQDAARRFSLYAQQAQTNGYGYQAYLVEAKVLPSYSKAKSDIEQELRVFEQDVPSEIKALTPKRWNWRDQAGIVKMDEEYDFLYLFTSMFMHATPMSISTDKQSLEPADIRVLLNYIRVRVLDAARMAEELLAEPVLLQ